ncbi:MAG: hypothetical protein GVY30_03550 [Chloroflexi bacterium]|nr:hypothetical protein [Chloroflexota bacterium]
MTWYASHIYAHPVPELVERVLAHRLLSRGAYRVDDLAGHEWPDPEYEHGLPPEGLLVIRELCGSPVDIPDQRSEKRWHTARNPIIPWEKLAGPPTIPVIHPPHLPVKSFGNLHLDARPDAYPPAPFLRFLKDLSLQTETRLIYYHHFSGAEMAAQQQFAWIFGPEERVYVAHQNLRVYTPDGQVRERPRGFLLELTMAHLGLSLTKYFGPYTPYFALHTRRFAWDQYKL